MPFDGFVVYETEVIWSAFERYLYAPYRNNPHHLTEMRRWYRGLNRLHRYHLDFVEVENTITNRSFQGFRLHGQMIFSDNSDVLLSPYPRSRDEPRSYYPSDKFVGVHLHDYGYNEIFFQECRREMPPEYEIELNVSELNPKFGSYAASITSQIDHELSHAVLPGSKVNIPADWELRLGYGGLGWHKDENSGYSKVKWTRVLVHPLMGQGTCYALGRRFVERAYRTNLRALTCPIGATSCHVAIYGTRYYRHGVAHRVPETPTGRAVLIKPDVDNNERWEPYLNVKTPFRVTPIMLPANM